MSCKILHLPYSNVETIFAAHAFIYKNINSISEHKMYAIHVALMTIDLFLFAYFTKHTI